MVAGSLVGLFVGLVVLFVHYDEAQAAVGQEEGGAEAQDDVRLRVGGHPAVDLPPVRSCLLGVVYQETVGEIPCQTALDLTADGYLRDEVEYVQPLF